MSEARAFEPTEGSARTVTVIPARIRALPGMPTLAVQKKRVAAYARVSTNSEEQLTSYEAQVKHYTEYIQSKEYTDHWQFVSVYTDKGITGTSTAKREGFNRMIQDALAGKIDLIITKSVSRFARNTVDTLTTIRKLKEHGVEVYFEEQNIYTLDGKGEVLLTIMSSIAQEESRNISENVTWGMRKRFAEGKVTMAYKQFMGYRRGKNGIPEVVEAEAKIIRTIFRRFLEGATPAIIARELNLAGIPCPSRKSLLGEDEIEAAKARKKTARWSPSTIESILTNEKYKGDAILQKTYCTDYIKKTFVVNDGSEIPKYYAQNSHPAIVSAEVFDLTQMEQEWRRSLKGSYSGKSCFASRIVCGDCGAFYGSKVWHSTDEYRRTIWRCNNKYGGDAKCSTPHVTQEELEKAFVDVMQKVITEKDAIFAVCREVLDEVLDTSELDGIAMHLQEQTMLISVRARRLVEENARVRRNQEEYQREYDALAAEHEKLSRQMQEVDIQRKDIVLLDIHLPGISGLEVLKVIRAELPKTKVIIISGMDDFETTRMAFQLGAYEYFHKPRIRSGDLLKMLKKLRDSFEGENKRSELKTGEATTQELLEDALRYPFEEEAAGELSRRIPMVSYCIMLVSLSDIYEKKKKNPKFNAKITFNAVVGLISELTSRRRDVEFFSVQSNEYFFLFRSDCMGEELLECVENFYTNLASMLNRFVDVNIHAGVSSVKHQYGDLPSAVQEAREANDHYFITENAFIQFTEIHINPADAREVTRLLGSLIDSAKQTQIDRHMECLQNLVTLMRRKETPNRKTLIHSAQSFIYYLAGVQYYEVDEDVIRIASCETLDQFLESYQGILEKLMLENSLQLGHDVVIQLREYLQTHFAEDISLQSLADEFHMSKTYISRVFKSEMGDNLFSYLNILRVEKSKQLLKGTGLKIYEIAAAVGYKSTVSFNYAFNRIVGESPSQYRERKRGAAGVEENPKGTDFSGSVPGMRE